MPPAIAAIGAAASAVGTAISSSALLTSLVTSVIGAALSFVASAIFQPEKPKPSDHQTERKQALPTRKIHYGRVKIAGDVAFYRDGHDGVKRSLFKILLLSAREIDAIETHYLNNEVVTLGEDDFVEESQYSLDSIKRVRLIEYLGTEDQAADDVMQANYDEWTTDHKLSGVAYVVAQYRAVGEKFSSVYPKGEPEHQALIRGNKLYDPRLDTTNGGSGLHRVDDQLTWEWSENAALAVLDWLMWPKKRGGFGFPAERFYWPDWIAKADLSDEDVPLKAGGTEKRWRIATTVDLTEPRTAVLKRLLDAGDFRLYRRFDGKIGLKGGEWEAPDVTLDGGAGHIIDGQISNGVASPDLYNELAFKYMSPAHGYVEVDGDPWQDASIEIPGGGFKKQPIDLTQVPSHGQGRRLAKLITARDNPSFLGEIGRTNLVGLDCLGAEVVTLSLPELDTPDDIVSGPFWIEGGVRVFGDVSGVSFVVRRARPDRYDWDAVTEEGTAPPVPDDPEDNEGIPEPEGFVVTVEQRNLGGGVVVAVAILSWDAIDSDHWIEAEVFKLVSGEEWLAIPVAPGAVMAEFLPLEEGISYEFRIRAAAPGLQFSDWVTVGPILVGGVSDILGAGGGDSMGAGDGDVMGA